MNERIAYSGTVNWPLFRRAQIKHVGWKWTVLLLFPASMLTLTAFIGHPVSSFVYLEGLGISTLFVPVMLLFWLFQWRRTFTRSPYLAEAISGTVSSEKFTARGSTGTTEMAWARFVNIKDGGDFLLLYHSPFLFNMLSRDFFESAELWQEARQIILRSSRRAG